MTVTITFDEKGGKTTLTIHALFASVAIKHEHVGVGYERGVGSSLYQLADVVAGDVSILACAKRRYGRRGEAPAREAMEARNEVRVADQPARTSREPEHPKSDRLIRRRQEMSAPMVIVAGHITVEPQQRESYLAGCVSVVEKARRVAGCLDFAITGDLVDPGRVNIFERWESQASVKAFRRSAPRNKQSAAMLSVSVAEYDIADERPLFGEGTA